MATGLENLKMAVEKKNPSGYWDLKKRSIPSDGFLICMYGMGRDIRLLLISLIQKVFLPLQGKKWGFSTVTSILHNDAYIGHKVWNRYDYVNFGKKKKPREEWIVAKDAEQAWYPAEMAKAQETIFVTTIAVPIIEMDHWPVSEIAFLKTNWSRQL